MNAAKQGKMLVAVDGSERAMEMVRYISGFKPFQRIKLVLFMVENRIPEFFWDQKRQPHFEWRITGVKMWEKQHDRVVRQYMDKARAILLDAGFPPENVKAVIHERKVGIARDILEEARKHYGAVAVSRRGRSRMQGLILGSTTTKLLHILSPMPLLVVGRSPLTGKVLVAMDNSSDAMKAVDYVAQTLGGDGVRVTLMHAIREGEAMEAEFPREPAKHHVEEDKEEMEKVFDQARNRLIKAGFEPAHINIQFITGAYSRAEAVIQEACRGGYGTIAVGRRGISRAHEFFMGRVSNKLIQVAREQAVWVIG